VNLLKKIDILFFIYLIISTLALLLSWDTIASPWHLFLNHAAIALLVLVLVYTDSKTDHIIVYLLRTTYPLIVSGYFYSETVFYNKLLFDNIDPFLMSLETKVFGMQASLLFSAVFSNKLFSELMYFSYFSFYLLIAAFILYMFFKKREYFLQVVFQLSVSLYMFYFIFMLIPSAGPQFYFLSPDNKLPEAYVFSHVMHFIQNVAEQPTGAFPSSHVGGAFIILLLSRKFAPDFYKLSWPFVGLIVLSTVYIKAHYAIDVIGGFVIAPFILSLSSYLFKFPIFRK